MPAHWCGSILAGYLCRRGGSRIAGYHFAHQVDTEFTRGVKFDSEALGVAILGIMHTSEHTDAHRCLRTLQKWLTNIFPAWSTTLHHHFVSGDSHGDY
jgi:hypothetical protein